MKDKRLYGSIPGKRSPVQDRAPLAAAGSGLAAVFSRAVALHQAGRLQEAEPLYRQVLRTQPHHFDSRHLLGVIHCQRGELQEAVAEIAAALKINPKVAAAHNNMGGALAALGRGQEAVESYGRAITLKPDDAEAYYNRGNVFREAGRFVEAIDDYDRALARRPNYAEALNNKGSALKGLGRLEQALEFYDRAIASRPDYAEAWYNRGNVLHELRRFEEAVASCDKSIAFKPGLAEAHNNRGNALKELRRFDEAVLAYGRAVALRPDYADAFNNLGNVLKDLRQFEDALANYDRAIGLRWSHAEAFYNRGLMLAELQRHEEALASFEKAIALKPDHAEALYARGTALLAEKHIEGAVASYEKAIALRPELSHLRGMRLHAKMQICDWTSFATECAELNEAAARGSMASYPFQLLACNSTPASLLTCARTYVANKCPPFPHPLWCGERYDHRRIRVAYVSADFRDHPVAHLTAGLFARHDRSRFETIAISFGRDEPGPTRERLRASFDRFVDADLMSDREVAELMRRSEIDIAVDLNGFTDGSRPNVFARRPAPVQVNYLGYAGTLGQDYCDYIIADRFVVPDMSRRHYAENVVYLPDTFMVNDVDRTVSPHLPSRAEAGLPETGFVFCCFNNSYKLTPDVFAVWMRLLEEVDGSVLWLSAGNPACIANLRREAEKHGIAADRLVFATRVPLNADHLARLRLADLFVDTLYYNAHATAADALWAGVPVLTCPGATFASRVAGSLLHAIGLPELVVGSLDDYRSLALSLAREPLRLASLREKLARHRTAYPLFDTDRFTRHLEAAYTQMWQFVQRGEPPRSFAIAAAGTNGGEYG